MHANSKGGGFLSRCEPGIFLALVVFSAFGFVIPPSPQGHLFVGIIITAAFACVGFLIFGGVLRRRDLNFPQWAAGALWIPVTALLIAVVILKLGMIQFGGFDHSALIDMGLRFVNGQHPYRDFPCTMPPVFYLGSGMAFRCFGISWWSLILVAAVFAAGTYVWAWFLLNKALRNGFLAWMFALLLQASTMILISYWWYNPVTTVAGSLFFLSAWCLIESPKSKPVWVSFVFSLALLALAKPNIAGLLIIGGGGILLLTPARLTAIYLTLVAIALTMVGMFSSGIAPLDIINGYVGIAGRGATLNQLFQDLGTGEKVLSSGILIALLLPWLAIIRKVFSSRSNPFLWLSMVGVASGVYGFLTNGELKLVDTFLVFIATFLAVSLVVRTQRDNVDSLVLIDPRWGAVYGIFASILIGISCAQAVTRHRVEGIGPGLFFEYQLSDQRFDTGFFKGLQTGRTFLEVYTEAQSALTHSRDQSVYFGPRMQWGYAAFGIAPPLHQPSWWHPGVSFPKNMESELIGEWNSHHFDLLIFLKNDVTYMSSEFLGVLNRSYSVDQSYPLLTILHRIH